MTQPKLSAMESLDGNIVRGILYRNMKKLGFGMCSRSDMREIFDIRRD